MHPAMDIETARLALGEVLRKRRETLVRWRDLQQQSCDLRDLERDLKAWLHHATDRNGELRERNKAIVEARRAGHTLRAIAEAHRISRARVLQIYRREMRREREAGR